MNEYKWRGEAEDNLLWRRGRIMADNSNVVPIQTTKLEINPIANVFRMMSGPELDELAQDIKENGLLDSIVLDKKGSVIDGRNRLKACQMAGVDLAFVIYKGDDVEAFVWSRGGMRRNVSHGMKAMALAMLYPKLAAFVSAYKELNL
ncbi:MAG: ParB N-terminal domain-containing protein [Rhodobacteraceae bacterium]|nr:ParB N-terminal domain-containing protein [Paracoccaceae bacterium]